MHINRRRWNNILILAIIAFIAILNLPTVIKTYLIDPPVNPYPHLLNPTAQLQALHFSDWSLELNQSRWRSSQPVSVAPEILAQRWLDLVGTEVDDATYDSLSPILRNPQTVEVWYTDQEEPQRITYYQTPQFWLLKNWQDKWIAVSADRNFLFPQ